MRGSKQPNPKNNNLQIVKLIISFLIPLFLMVGGISLLFLRLPGWSIILGMPVTIMGVVFLVYSYDEILIKRLVKNEEEEY